MSKWLWVPGGIAILVVTIINGGWPVVAGLAIGAAFAVDFWVVWLRRDS